MWSTHLTIWTVSIGQGSTFCKVGIVKWTTVLTTRAVFIGWANTFHTTTEMAMLEASVTQALFHKGDCQCIRHTQMLLDVIFALAFLIGLCFLAG